MNERKFLLHTYLSIGSKKTNKLLFHFGKDQNDSQATRSSLDKQNYSFIIKSSKALRLSFRCQLRALSTRRPSGSQYSYCTRCQRRMSSNFYWSISIDHGGSSEVKNFKRARCNCLSFQRLLRATWASYASLFGNSTLRTRSKIGRAHV